MVGGCCKLLSCLKFARLTKASVLDSFDGCDGECVLGFVLDSVSPDIAIDSKKRWIAHGNQACILEAEFHTCSATTSQGVGLTSSWQLSPS
jgi:hypothetical protein